VSAFSSSFPRAFCALACALLALVSLSACGRSDLNDYVLGDGGGGAPDAGTDTGPPDSGPCNSTTCPAGCCDPTGQCAAGSSLGQCGTFGEACESCPAEGFQICDPTRHACGNPEASCNSTTCAGCCEGNVCFAGTDPNECGFGAASCQHCENSGLACMNEQCAQPPCGAGTCSGCCFGQECLPGTDPTACGSAGQVCGNCLADGQTCQAESSGGICTTSASCAPGNCVGCCLGDSCMAGTDPSTCGSQGQACTDCATLGEGCAPTAGEDEPGGFCFATCGPQNCGGCCAGSVCVAGVDPSACGSGGGACVDCAAMNATCANGDAGVAVCTMAPPPPVCDAQTCPFGCCDGVVCMVGNLDSFCGSVGNACVDCAAENESCSAQSCVAVPPTCTTANCQGCCDAAGECQPGFVDTQCGQSGASCLDCTQLASTCDVGALPRTCQSLQTQCPAPYPSCPAALETPSPAQQDVCPPSDLQNAAAACEGGAHTAACNSFFAFEQANDPPCSACLGAFDFDFSERTGLTTCVAPFVDPTCNHSTACAVDCTHTACAQCVDPAALQQCQAAAPNSVCATYDGAATCIEGALLGGAASFCAPVEAFGDWLAVVGQNYCAQ
jgi:hypothetical protein